MVLKVFVLGLPGSGKSTVARYIDMIARDDGWTTTHINDYDILYEWYQDDIEGTRFSPTAYGGFDVHDLKVFDKALQEMESRARLLEEQIWQENKIIVIEFSRNDYCKALSWFTAPFLRNAYFLFLSTDIPTCKDRIRERAVNPTTENDHFVSDYIFEVYYDKDNREYTLSDFNTERDSNRQPYAISAEHIRVIDNTDTRLMQDFLQEVKHLTKVMMQRQAITRLTGLPQVEALKAQEFPL